MNDTLNPIDRDTLPRVVYNLDALDKNIARMREIESLAGGKLTILYALKASYGVLPYFRDKGIIGEVSSLSEALLSNTHLGGKSHAFCVSIKDREWAAISPLISHISFNSLSQGEQFHSRAQKEGISCGLRINPRHSVVSQDDYHADYDPCKAGCRFGADVNELPKELPEWVSGLHMHALCESGAEDFTNVLAAFERGVGHLLPKLKWVNLGGGQLCTSDDFDRDSFTTALREFSARHPHLALYLEPGEAWVWNGGTLESEVVDIVEAAGVKTIIVDFSFRAHGSDFLVGSAMETLPLEVDGFTLIEDKASATEGNGFLYHFGGASCAMCDTKGVYRSEKEIRKGDILRFRNMGFYFDVTFSWFNGIVPPSIVYQRGEETQIITKREPEQFLSAVRLPRL
jgi:carboxynorspermidine decarboxylase